MSSEVTYHITVQSTLTPVELDRLITQGASVLFDALEQRGQPATVLVFQPSGGLMVTYRVEQKT